MNAVQVEDQALFGGDLIAHGIAMRKAPAPTGTLPSNAVNYRATRPLGGGNFAPMRLRLKLWRDTRVWAAGSCTWADPEMQRRSNARVHECFLVRANVLAFAGDSTIEYARTGAANKISAVEEGGGIGIRHGVGSL
jgi:hypothetical protein